MSAPVLDLEPVRSFPNGRCVGLAPSTAHRRFFTAAGEAEAVAYCLGCPARVACAVSALEEEARTGDQPHGVRGALTASERRVYLERKSQP